MTRDQGLFAAMAAIIFIGGLHILQAYRIEGVRDACQAVYIQDLSSGDEQ